MMRLFIFTLILICHTTLIGQIERIEPLNWWVGMKNSELQLMLYGQGLGAYSVTLDDQGNGVELKKTNPAKSKNYLFLDLQFATDAKAGTLSFTLSHPKSGDSIVMEYELKDRDPKMLTIQGFDSSDVVYLITPDRFANADPENDSVEGMLEMDLDRSHDYKRHGGDIGGITQHIDYLADMGFTAIWSSPVLENNMPEQSYHGYAMTDFYKVDPRFGTLEDYKELSNKSSTNGIKLIMDQVANHCGSEHWWMQDLPFEDWVNYQSEFENGERLTVTNHRRTTNQDPYASAYDKQLMEKGWFVSAMPDLNQNNPYLANYLIQNSIWWIETLALGGIRQDTYPYPNKEFMAKWANTIMTEYPNFNIVGEEWSYNPLLVGYWQSGSSNKDGYESHLKSTMDFPLQKALVEALTEEESWDKGLIKLYEGLANDFHYTDPNSILLFGDNHDMDRIYTQLGEDVNLTKMALAFILTSPRIPQVYYGTEILMQNSAKPGDHGLIRTDFPGGWNGDTQNAFTGKGLTENQVKMQEFLRTMLQFRKGSNAIHRGTTKHFAPANGVYTLFRTIGDEMVILILNKNESPVTISLDRFKEMEIEGKRFFDVLENYSLELNGELDLDSRGILVLSKIASK
ncbi:glycoside hydrolase family 13 protein [Flagellimonas spongiicola]|nr:glycoside hydrolase family 13 protein [Allomuricauda spongiicola]